MRRTTVLWCLILVTGPSAARAAQPTLPEISEVTLFGGSPLHIALDGFDADGHALRFAAVSSDPLVETFIPQGNRSLKLEVRDFGVLVFELFEGRVPRVTQRIIQLAESGFYDGVLFHRVVDGFVIQAGDPSGTGTAGSELGPFDDQFHVDLQHNRAGVLSMAKTTLDDTNDSQFFITETPQRQLDFNHSIFGLLVEGESVRQAISNVPVDGNERPLADVVIDSARVFVDPQNAVLMLKAPEGATGEATITVTATDQQGLEVERVFHVNVVPDEVNSPPFLADMPEITTSVDTPASFQLTAIDVEGDPAYFLDEVALDANGLPVPVRSHPDLDHSVDFNTGLVTVTPRNGLVGDYAITVATGVNTNAVDYQVVAVHIVP